MTGRVPRSSRSEHSVSNRIRLDGTELQGMGRKTPFPRAEEAPKTLKQIVATSNVVTDSLILGGAGIHFEEARRETTFGRERK